jgi:hypothetical protein
MPIIAKSSGGSFEPIPTGIQQAVCYAVYDIGNQKGSYQGKSIIRHQVIICWELDCTMHDGKPFGVNKFYTNSLHEKASLRKDLESWRGKKFTAEELEGFDLEKLIGANCTMNIIDYEKKDSSIGQKFGAIMPKMPNAQKMIAVNHADPVPAWIEKYRAESVEVHPESTAPVGTEMPGDAFEPPQENLPF